MYPNHIHRTALIYFPRLFEFLRMPISLKGAPETFQICMESLRKDLSDSFFVYLDDVILSSLNENEHLLDITEVLKAIIDKKNFKFKLDKCKFARSEVKCLGFLIGNYGIRTDPKNIHAVKNFNIPKT
jgi:hypothetical protein